MGSNYFSKIIHYLASSNEFSYGNRLHICIYSSGDEFFFESLFSLENYWRSKLKLKKKITSIENGLILSGKIFKNPIENLPFKKNKKTYWNQWSYQNHAINESFIKGLKNLRIEKEIFGLELFNEFNYKKIYTENHKINQTKIILSLGQFLINLLSEKTILTEIEKELLEFYLKNVPLVVGHWGSFKKILKIIEYNDDLLLLYAVALARIDGFKANYNTSIDSEDLSILLEFFDSNVAHPITFDYLGRRGRRFFKNLLLKNEKKYVLCAMEYLLNIDRFEKSEVRILSEIIYGAHAYDTLNGRGIVSIPPDFERNNKRLERNPVIWNQNINIVKIIWRECSKLEEIQIWAYKIFRSNNETIPELTHTGLSLALVGSHEKIKKIACNQISKDPSKFIGLNVNAGVEFFQSSTVSGFNNVLKYIEQHPTRSNVKKSVYSFIKDNGFDEIVNENYRIIYPNRTQKLLGFSFRHLQKDLSQDEILKLGIYIGNTTRFKPSAFWRKSFSLLSLEILIQLRLKIPDLSKPIIEIIDQSCEIKIKDKKIDRELVIKLSLSPSKILNDLAWKELTSETHQSTLELVWDNLIENSGNEQGLDLLKRTVIDLNKLNTLLALDNASGKLSRIAILLIPYEHSASRRALNDLASTEDAEIILNTLDEISLRFPEWPWLKEQKLIKKLIIKNHEFYELLWKKLELDESISLINKLKSIPEILFPFIQILKSIKFINLSKKQSQLLTNLILLKPNWFLNDRNLMIQTATNSNLSVSLTAINLLEARDKIKDYYIQLLESRFPIAFEASQRYLEHVSDSKTLSKTIINICDSSVKEVREQGLIMLRNRIGDYNPYEVHSALAENKAPEISEVVARYALEEGILNLKAIKQFDKRILKTRSTSRKAKNLVKSRLESTHHKNILPIQLNASERKERINTLLALARGLSKRDKEWALLELAKLALSGEKIPSLQINKTY